MTLALGIDPGTATTGYGLVRLMPDGELVAVDFGVILTPKDATPSARLVMLFDELNKILKKHKPDTSTGLAVGQARGVILLALEKAKIPAYEYTPNEIKQAVAGYGSAEKRQVQEMVRALLQLKTIPKPDDAADALAVAITHLNTTRYE